MTRVTLVITHFFLFGQTKLLSVREQTFKLFQFHGCFTQNYLLTVGLQQAMLRKQPRNWNFFKVCCFTEKTGQTTSNVMCASNTSDKYLLIAKRIFL